MIAFARSRGARRPWRDMRVAVVGCGTIAEMGHLPALEAMGLEPALLVDRDLDRARQLQATLRRPQATILATDIEAHLDAFDAAIVAVPHHLHASLATMLLRAGKHVLLEKPMATTPEDCEAIAAAAAESTGVLSIGLIRRYWENVNWARDLIRQGGLGEIESFDIRDGARAITIASDFALKRETSGGGVLMNLGVHVLDEVLWWFGPVASFEYRDDAYGGNEVNCELDLMMASGARGTVELSFNRQLRGTAIIRGTRGTLELELYGHGITATPPSLLDVRAGGVLGRDIKPSSPLLAPIFSKEIGDWLEAALGLHAPRVPGDAHHAQIARLIQDCYAERSELSLPWMHPDEAYPPSRPAATVEVDAPASALAISVNETMEVERAVR